MKLKVGYIGSGHTHSGAVFDTLLRSPDFEIVGFSEVAEDTTPPRFSAVPRLPLEAILSDKSIPAVFIETKEKDSLDVALQCAAAGKAIHMDKPAGMDAPKFERVLSLLKKQNLPISLGYMYRHNAAVRYAIKAAREGRLGTIQEVVARMGVAEPPEERARLVGLPCGILYFLVCHLIDLIYTVQGVPEEIVPLVYTHEQYGIRAADDATVLMKYKDGVSIARSDAREVNGYGRREFTVMGDKGTIEIKPIENPMLTREAYAADSPPFRLHWQEVQLPPPTGRYDVMISEFADMVRGKLENPYTYEHEARLQRMLLYAVGYDIDWKGEIAL